LQARANWGLYSTLYKPPRKDYMPAWMKMQFPILEYRMLIIEFTAPYYLHLPTANDLLQKTNRKMLERIEVS